MSLIKGQGNLGQAKIGSSSQITSTLASIERGILIPLVAFSNVVGEGRGGGCGISGH